MDRPLPFEHLNAFHAAGECRRQVNKMTNCVNNVTIVEFHDHNLESP